MGQQDLGAFDDNVSYRSRNDVGIDHSEYFCHPSVSAQLGLFSVIAQLPAPSAT
jgi:hypothetical protein